jgi:hypothetical protein
MEPANDEQDFNDSTTYFEMLLNSEDLQQPIIHQCQPSTSSPMFEVSPALLSIPSFDTTADDAFSPPESAPEPAPATSSTTMTRKRKQGSVVWQFFELVNGTGLGCLLCKRSG